MKRIIAILLVLVVLIGALSVSAAASDLDFSPVEYAFVTEYQLFYQDTELHASGVYQGTNNFDMTKNVGDSKPTFTYISPDSDARDFELWLTTPVWEGYDFIDVQLQFRVSHITSISATLGDVNIPIEYGYVSDSSFDGQSFYLTVRMDLRGLKSTSADPVLKVCGMFSWEYTSLVALTACSGVAIIQDPELNFFESILAAIADFRNSMGSWLEGLFEKYFGDGGAEIQQSVQTQEQINNSVNMHLTDAIGSWNNNADLIDSTFTIGISGAAPALVWLGNLATSLYNNMGWFGNILLGVAFVRALMLVLSKSGLSRAIGNSRKYDSGSSGSDVAKSRSDTGV